MAFPGSIYAPPGVYTRTLFESPAQGLLEGLKIPIFIGTGSEILVQSDLEVVRGSSSSVDQQVVQEDLDGRVVAAVSATGAITLGPFDGVEKRVQVRNYPIVTGDGSGTTATKTSAVSVTINGQPIVVLYIDGANGVLELSTAPKSGDVVRATYFFNRTDTQATDDLSDQITSDSAQVYGQVGETYAISADVNDTLILTIDETEYTITLPDSGASPWSASQVASFINSGAVGSTLLASTYVNNFGNTAVLLTADRDIVVGTGSANSTLGFTGGYNTSRNKVFYTFQGPIVDGSNGGITSTDPADVVVRVDGVQVIPTALDGSSRAVTLPFAPENTATVTVAYYYNTWQDTFDYLAHREITDITQAGVTPGRNDFVDEVDFVLKNDLILWGTAVTIVSGEHTQGTEFFDDTQITATLVDTRGYLQPCSAVTNTAVNPPVTSTTEFQLPLVPTTGNGRSSPLGSSLFQTVSNGRIDLPTNRPDLVTAYWGFGVQDAFERGPVDVLRVESETATITLKDEVPVGAEVFATFYYNTLQDGEHTTQVVVPGASGVGTYQVNDSDGNAMMTPQFGSKGTGLTGITIQFPSGSESKPDVRFETPFDSTYLQGAVEEDVTVTFRNKDGTLGRYTVPGAGPYYFIRNASDNLVVEVDGAAVSVGGIIDLADLLGENDLGFWATMVGSEVEYDPDSGALTYEIDSSNNEINLTVDGVLIEATSATGTLDLAAYVTALNTAALATPPQYAAAAKFTSAVTISLGEYDALSFHYNGDPAGAGASGNLTCVIAPTLYNSPTLLAAAVELAMTNRIATLVAFDANFAGLAVSVNANADGQMVFALTKATGDAYGYLEFTQAATQASVVYTVVTAPLLVGDAVLIGALPPLIGVAGPAVPGTDTFDATTPLTPVAMAAELVTQINDPLNTYAGFVNAVDNLDGTLTVTYLTGGAANNGSPAATATVPPGGITPIAGTFTGGVDYPDNAFSVLAGIDTDTATGEGQVKLVDGPIARRFSITGGSTGSLLNDRIILRNRLVPGNTTVSAFHVLGQTGIEVEGSTGADLAGLSVGEIAPAGLWATVLPATLLGTVGFSGGQVPAGFTGDARDGQPLVTFYAAGGTTPRNNVFKFTYNGTPVTIQFTDATGAAIPSGGSADVALGPAGIAGGFEFTILGQIVAGLASALGIAPAVVLAANVVRQEGAGIRLTSSAYDTTSSIVIGTGNANDALGFSDGEAASRTAVDVGTLASALMADSQNPVSVPNALLDWENPDASTFAGEALALVQTDDSNAEYLFIQSQGGSGLGTSSSVAFDDAGLNNALLPGTGFGVVSGDGGSGEAGISGFFVTSSDPVDGSGTVNNSILNDGSAGSGIGDEGDGQDGTVGQTYRDMVTGLTFTVLPREGGTNYPGLSLTDSFTFRVRREVLTDSNLPVNTIPGVELLVTNTLGVGAGDTAIVETFERGGNEPAIGDVYYVSYEYQKQDFTTQLFTKFNAIEAAYGELSLDNPVTLASFLAITNGAVLVGIKQVEKDIDSDNDGVGDSASVEAFRTAVDELEGSLAGGTLPDILVPLRGDSVDLFAYMTRHADIQSSIRYRAERTVMAGVNAGTEPRDAQAVAQAVARDRFRLVYPDIATLSIDRADGTSEEFVVGGPYLASALVGSVVSPNVDVATPWTGRKLFGFNQLSRVLDAVEQNQTAVRGVTVLEDRPPVIRVRHGLTSDMTSVLTKTPTIILIADEVQQQTRKALDRFIGIKFLPGILSQIEGQLSTTLKQLVEAQIIAAYTGVKANTSPDDPTVAEVEAYYQPIFPLLYLVVTFNLRSSL
jgi:hypothetical protein